MTDYISRDDALNHIREYIDEYGEWTDENGWHSDKWCAMKEAEGVLEKLPAADVRPKWISVEDELPGLEQDVLVSVKIRLKGDRNPRLVVARDYINTDGKWDNAGRSWRWEVTHWMPLPEPPNCGAKMEEGDA